MKGGITTPGGAKPVTRSDQSLEEDERLARQLQQQEDAGGQLVRQARGRDDDATGQ